MSNKTIFCINKNRVLSQILVIQAVMLFLVACTFFEAPAPPRSFAVEDLLLDQTFIPSVWKDAWGPFFPAGNEMSTRESTAIQFGVAEREAPIQAQQMVYRYRTDGVARLTFENEYLPQVGFFSAAREWTYQSQVADRSFFGCYDWEGRDIPVCEWAGQYEEYIVVFWTRMTPDEVTLADIEKAVRAIDERMTSYLKEPTPTPNIK